MQAIKSISDKKFSQSQSNYDFLCMNPNCNHPSSRFFGSSEVGHHLSCSGWILQKEDTIKITGQQIKKVKNVTEKNTFNFKSFPLKQIFQISTLFQHQNNNNLDQSLEESEIINHENPIQILKSYFQMIKTKIENELAKVFYEIQDRIIYINQIQEKTNKQIQKILSVSDHFKILGQIDNSDTLKQYKKFCDTANSFTLIHEEKISKQFFKILQAIENIGKSFWNIQLQSITKQKEIIEKAKKSIQEYNKSQEIHPYVKVQNLANLYQIGIVQPSVQEDKLLISMCCWLCQKNCNGEGNNIKQRKASASKNLFDHLINTHENETKRKFQNQVVSSAPHRIVWKQFIAQIEQRNYQQFIIIDRQNKSKFFYEGVNEMNSQQIYTLNVLSSQNEHIGVGRYILASSQGKDAADTLMIMIVYAIVTSGYYRLASRFHPEKKPKITLVTKDHFADTLQSILKCEFGVQIEIVK